MKLTKQQLKQIIREELESVLEEGIFDRLAAAVPGTTAKKHCDTLKERLRLAKESLNRIATSGWRHTDSAKREQERLTKAITDIKAELAEKCDVRIKEEFDKQ